MNIPSFLAVFPGFLAGNIAWLAVSHWLRLLFAAVGNAPEAAQPGYRKQGAPKGAVWAMVFSVLHPVTWLLLVGVPYGLHRLVTAPPRAGWLWFWAGAALALVLISVLAIVTVVKIRRRTSGTI